jgi:hypothetical protein
MTKTSISLASLDARKASEQPFEFEYITPQNEFSGIFLSVLGAQSPSVVAETARLLTERRRKEVASAAVRSRSAAQALTVEDDIEFGQKVTAVKLVGWRGITEEFTPERALQLIQSNTDVADQINSVSNDLANFMKASPKV